MTQSRTFKLLHDVTVIGAPIPVETQALLKMLMNPPFRLLAAGTEVTVRPLRSFNLGGRVTTSLECIVTGEETACSWGVDDNFELYSGFPLSELSPPDAEKVELPPMLREMPAVKRILREESKEDLMPVPKKTGKINLVTVGIFAVVAAGVGFLIGHLL